MEQTKVLLVDDEQDIVDTIKYSLELRGFDVDATYDGISALAMARSQQYQVLILDVMLPGKNGYEVSKILKEEIEQGKLNPFGIVLITARKLDSELREEFVSTWSKADVCIYKPFEMEDLLEKLDTVLETVEGQRSAT
ncbi:MAG: response regulator [Candidatus Krumholzibacteria bacterium]|nr:response regulator [Candidatus Krumholzibacteria bacterium]